MFRKLLSSIIVVSLLVSPINVLADTTTPNDTVEEIEVIEDAVSEDIDEEGAISGEDILDYEIEADEIDVVESIEADSTEPIMVSEHDLSMPHDTEFSYSVDFSNGDYQIEEEEKLPAYYNPLKEDYGYTLPATRDQNPWGTCWAFSSIALAEIERAKNAGEPYDFSENHLAYFTYNTDNKDPLGNLDGYGKVGFTLENYANSKGVKLGYLENGGNILLGAYTLTNWIGTANEVDFVYPQDPTKLNKAASGELAYDIDASRAINNSGVHVKNYYKVNPKENREAAKRLIKEYGAIGTLYNHNDAYYNSANNSYYRSDNPGTNHLISIVGWDDSFDKTHFNTEALDNGAWLIRNSWTTDSSMSMYGYFWMSYYDASLYGLAMAFECESADEYDNNYQYDGSMDCFGITNLYKCANVFTANAKCPHEYIKGVSFATESSNVTYTMKVYVGVEDGKPESGDLKATVNGKTTYPGYYTVALDKPITVERGTKFSVVLECDKDFIVVEGDWLDEPGKQYWMNAQSFIKDNQSFYSFNDKWYDFRELAEEKGFGNFKIKAFTKNDTDDAIKVDFDAKGGYEVDPAYYISGEPYNYLPTAVRKGYKFTGWYKDEAGTGDKVTEESIVDSSNHTLYAGWEPIQYSIRFNANGGKGEMPDQICTYDKAVVLSANSLENPGYNFVGWSTTSDGDVKYGDGATVEDNLVSEDGAVVTLYANWEAIDVTVILDYQGGTGSKESINTKYAEKYGREESLPEAKKEGCTFRGWFTEREGGIEITDDTVCFAVSSEITLYAHFRSDERVITFDEIPEAFYYTGKAITPRTRVFNGKDELVAGVDYSVTYKNNVNAGTKDAKDAKGNDIAPRVIIKGKGNFSSSIQKTLYFEIKPLNLKDADLTVSAIKYDGKEHKNVVPKVTYGGKSLSNKKDFIVKYGASDFKTESSDTVKHIITIEGGSTGNYIGDNTVELEIVGQDKVFMSKVSVDKIANINWDEEVHKPIPIVKYGKKNQLKWKEDYTVEFPDAEYVSAGTHNIDIIGNPEKGYVGTKRVTFNIVGVPMSKVKVNGIINLTYDGQPKTMTKSGDMMENLELSFTQGKGTSAVKTTLVADEDYIVEYLTQNVNAGTVKVKITGKGQYSGSVTKSFKILPKVVSEAGVTVEDIPNQMYTKLSAKAKPIVSYNGMILVEGKDYKLSYKNATKVTPENPTDKQKAVVTITGIKNYKGKVNKTYIIDRASILSSNDLVEMIAPDVVVNTSKSANAGKSFVSPILIEKSTGKILKAGTDYEKAFKYTLSGNTINKTDAALPVGTEVTVTVTGKGNYKAEELSTTYHVISAESDIAKYKVSVDAQSYTADPITLTKEQIVIKKDKKATTPKLSASEYEILEDTYMNNTKRGTATVYVRGVGDKAGLLKVTFKIVPMFNK